jgi:hypothetical protein
MKTIIGIGVGIVIGAAGMWWYVGEPPLPLNITAVSEPVPPPQTSGELPLTTDENPPPTTVGGVSEPEKK